MGMAICGILSVGLLTGCSSGSTTPATPAPVVKVAPNATGNLQDFCTGFKSFVALTSSAKGGKHPELVLAALGQMGQNAPPSISSDVNVVVAGTTPLLKAQSSKKLTPAQVGALLSESAAALVGKSGKAVSSYGHSNCE
jgi:hypothetical protein